MNENFIDKDLLIMGGDFNLVMDSTVDRLNSTYNHDKSLMVLKEYVDRDDLVDVWRAQHPEDRSYSWFRNKKSGGISASRIDMLFTSESYMDCVVSSKLSAGYKTDHSFVEMNISLDTYDRGPGAWKLNTQHLLKEEYKELINDTIEKVVANTPCLNPSDRWTEIKIACANASKAFSKQNSVKRKTEFNNLLELKSRLLEDQCRNPYNVQVRDGLSQVELRIQTIADINVDSARFRAQANWAEYGEKNNKKFFALEKKRYMAKNMKMIIKESGQHVFDQKAILEEQCKFYKNLYTKNPNVHFNITRDYRDPQLDCLEKSMCDSDISIDELFDAVMTLKRGKCSGGDGLPNEFYYTFFKRLSPHLLAMANHSFEISRLPKSTKRGIISLLPKKNKDSRYIKNLRPLTLLNSDYKVIAKVFDNRLRVVLPSLIHEDQTGFLANRRISTNIRKTLDIIEYTKDNKIPGIILSVDMEKCFDKIDYSAIYGALRYYGFGEKYINWV